MSETWKDLTSEPAGAEMSDTEKFLKLRSEAWNDLHVKRLNCF